MISTTHALLLIGVMALGTMALRFLPFVLFSKGTPNIVLYLGEVLPYAVIAMLVVYCLKGTQFLSAPYGMPEVIAVLLVVLLHKWKHSTILSILAGTICYMMLIRILPWI